MGLGERSSSRTTGVLRSDYFFLHPSDGLFPSCVSNMDSAVGWGLSSLAIPLGFNGMFLAGCSWLWTGSTDGVYGYPSCLYDGKTVRTIKIFSFWWIVSVVVVVVAIRCV